MTEKINVKKAALSLGILFALLHAIGSLLISSLMEFWQWIHFVRLQPYVISSFSFETWIIGILTAFLSGAFIGIVFAALYNKL